ncbi:MAG: hypothetical protein AAF203_06515 [Pseudomonadota bacterium]
MDKKLKVRFPKKSFLDGVFFLILAGLSCWALFSLILSMNSPGVSGARMLFLMFMLAAPVALWVMGSLVFYEIELCDSRLMQEYLLTGRKIVVPLDDIEKFAIFTPPQGRIKFLRLQLKSSKEKIIPFESLELERTFKDHMKKRGLGPCEVSEFIQAS